MVLVFTWGFHGCYVTDNVVTNIFLEMATGGHQSNRVSLSSVHLQKMNG